MENVYLQISWRESEQNVSASLQSGWFSFSLFGRSLHLPLSGDPPLLSRNRHKLLYFLPKHLTKCSAVQRNKLLSGFLRNTCTFYLQALTSFCFSSYNHASLLKHFLRLSSSVSLMLCFPGSALTNK